QTSYRTTNALLQGTQARDPRPDREESLRTAAREGGARHWRRRPDEGRGAYPWGVLRPLRFAGSAGERGFCLCDGSGDGALAQARRTDATGQAAGGYRRFI